MEEFHKKITEETEKIIGAILEDGIKEENIDLLSKTVDIHKDIKNEEYWKKKEENEMRYRGYSEGPMGNYGNYGREQYGEYGEGSYGRRMRDSRGRYMARGYDTKYRGEETLGEMHESYQAYSEGKESFGRGNYGAKEDTMKSLQFMLESAVDFFHMLKDDASSQEEVEMIKKYARKISEM